MRNTKAKLLRSLTRAASPMTAKPHEIRAVYRGIKAIYSATPRPKRAALTLKLAGDAREIAAFNVAKSLENA